MVDQQLGQFSLAMKRRPMESAGMMLTKSIHWQSCSGHETRRNRVTISCRVSHMPPACGWKYRSKARPLRKQVIHHRFIMEPAGVEQFFFSGTPFHQQLKDRLMAE